jgi:hypothetical protein
VLSVLLNLCCECLVLLVCRAFCSTPSACTRQHAPVQGSSEPVRVQRPRGTCTVRVHYPGMEPGGKLRLLVPGSSLEQHPPGVEDLPAGGHTSRPKPLPHARSETCTNSSRHFLTSACLSLGCLLGQLGGPGRPRGVPWRPPSGETAGWGRGGWG